MKKWLKCILSLWVCVLVLLPGLQVSAETLTEGLYEYSVEDGKATIVRYTAVSESVKPGIGVTICIPEQLGGYPVVSIGERAFTQHNIQCIIMPDSIVSIQELAFCECWILSDIVIPDSVEKIGQSAFYHTRITRLVIPASVTYLEDLTFDGCHDLEKVYYMGDVPQSDQSNYPCTGNRFMTYCLQGASGWNQIEWGGTILQRDKLFSEGDVNDDGIRDLHDAQLALKWALNLGLPDALQVLAADMDGDGTVTLKDAKTILKIALNLAEL